MIQVFEEYNQIKSIWYIDRHSVEDRYINLSLWLFRSRDIHRLSRRIKLNSDHERLSKQADVQLVKQQLIV